MQRKKQEIREKRERAQKEALIAEIRDLLGTASLTTLSDIKNQLQNPEDDLEPAEELVFNLLAEALNDSQLAELCYFSIRSLWPKFQSGISEDKKRKMLVKYFFAQNELTTLFMYVRGKNISVYFKYHPKLRKMGLRS